MPDGVLALFADKASLHPDTPAPVPEGELPAQMALLLPFEARLLRRLAPALIRQVEAGARAWVAFPNDDAHMRAAVALNGLRVCTRINPLLQLGFRRRAVEVIAIQICAASQRGSRYWRKTSVRYGEAGPKRALCVEVGTKGQVISRTDSQPGVHRRAPGAG